MEWDVISYRHRILAFAILVVCTSVAGARSATDPVNKGLRFNSPGVLDLAERSQGVADGNAVPAGELAASDAEAIFATPAQHEMTSLVFSDEVYGCRKPSHQCSLEHERALIAASAGSVKREGKRLIVVPAGGVPIEFIDWKQPTTKTADGDSEEHWYLGRLPGSGYQRVEVDFGQDSPGNFLISPQSGKVAFVHNGDDIAVPSPDGRLLVTFNVLNSPLSVRVGALDAAGPRMVVQCQASDRDMKLTPVFKGWHDNSAFDLVVEIGAQSKAMQRLAIRLAARGEDWTLAASDAARLAAIGLLCRQH